MNFKEVIINESCYKKEEIRKYNCGKKKKKSGYTKNKVFTKQTKREVRYNVNEQNGRIGEKSVQTSQYGKKFSSAYERNQNSKTQAQNSKWWEVGYNVNEQNGRIGEKSVQTSQYGKKFPSAYERSQDSKMQAQNREVRYNVNEQNCRIGENFMQTSQYWKKFPSGYERSQDSKMHPQNSSYYGNSRNYSETRAFKNEYQNEDGEYYSPSLLAIPTAITFSPTQTLNERDRVINSLKGQVQAYKEILKHQKKENFSLKINLACEKMISALKTRQTLKPFIEDDGVITQAINFILEQTSFYEDCELKMKKLSTLLEQESEHFKILFSELNIEKLLKSKMELTSLKEKLEAAYEETKSSSLFSEVNRGSSLVTTESKIGQDFISWKNKYLELQSSGDKMVEALCFSLEECASSFRNLIKSVGNEEVTHFNFEHGELALKNFSDEVAHSEKMDVIPSTCIELLKEIKARIAKMNNVETAVENVSKLNSQLTNRSSVIKLSVGKEEKNYPTLLSFANLSRTLPYLKYSITRDIFHSLSDMHKKDVVYGFLSPQNVLISGGGAVLRSVDTVSKEEPIPDFNFFSPEIDPCNSMEPSTADSPSVNLAVDYYSLGRLIIWLSSKGVNENFIDHALDIMRRFPFIEKLVSVEPKERPSFVEFKEFMNFLPDLYYSCDFSPIIDDDSAAIVLENSFETGSDLSTLSIVSKILDKERNVIYKETEDSDIDSEDDDNDDDGKTLEDSTKDSS